MKFDIKLEQLNKSEAIRYMGGAECIESLDAATVNLISVCETKVLEVARPAYVYGIYDIVDTDMGIELEGTNLVLPGESIKNHLKGCCKAALMAVTISSDIDKLIRVSQVDNMAEAVVIDSLSSVAVEQACDKVESMIAQECRGYYATYRFGVGYGDLSISIQKNFINVLNAQKLIGLNVTSSGILTPTKSVTAVIGLSEEPIKHEARGCITCNMKETCIYRKKGGRCNE